MDELHLFSRNNGEKNPVVIIDGHESRLHPTFLEYINNPNNKWFVVLGVPYATSYWQVGDSNEQNGRGKVKWFKEKHNQNPTELTNFFGCYGPDALDELSLS